MLENFSKLVIYTWPSSVKWVLNDKRFIISINEYKIFINRYGLTNFISGIH